MLKRQALFLRRIAGWNRRSGRDGGAGSSAASAAGGLALCRCGLGGGRAAFARVVVHIKAGTLEFEGRHGEHALQRALALGADSLGFGSEVLDFFNAVAALGTTIDI